MISQELTWQGLIPNLSSFQTKFVSSETLTPAILSDIQPRLSDGIQHFVDEFAQTRFMFIKSDESETYLSLYANAITPLLAEINTIDGDYQLSEDNRVFQWENGVTSRFSSRDKIAYRNWIEPEQLFGYVTPSLNLVPGLLHQINGGILVIAASTLINQPLMWARLKNMVNRQQLEWLPYSDNQPLPIEIEPQPLELKVIIVGDRLALEEFEFTSPELFSCAIYGEYEPVMFFEDEEQLTLWMRYIKSIIDSNKLPNISPDGWLPLSNKLYVTVRINLIFLLIIFG